MLGLVTTMTGNLERRDDLRRRIEEAAVWAPLDRLCLSPHCGFSSIHHGNDPSVGEPWTKLALVVDAAREVWGWPREFTDSHRVERTSDVVSRQEV